MTTILAIDSSTEACSCALHQEGHLVEKFELIPREHARQILPMIQTLLQEQGLSFEELDALAVGAGPGSFTGLRIAAGVAQGIAYGAGLPLVPVSTLAAIAKQAQAGETDYVLACLDARINEVYWGIYTLQEDAVILNGKERLTDPGQLILDEEGSYMGLGSGMSFLQQMPEQTRHKIRKSDVEIYPRAAAIAQLAVREFQKGNTVEPSSFSPTYLRNQVTR